MSATTHGTECGAELAVSAAAAGDRVVEWQRCVRRVCVSILNFSATEGKEDHCACVCDDGAQSCSCSVACSIYRCCDCALM